MNDFKFQPEFTHVAFPSVPTSSSQASTQPQEFSFASRHALQGVESLVEELLLVDELLGLSSQGSESPESCCLDRV